MNSILITGGSGFIGSHFAEVFDAKKIVNLDLIAPMNGQAGCFQQGDVRVAGDLDRVLSSRPFDTIICLAAEHRDFGIPRQSYFDTNAEGTRQICAAANRHGVKKIVFYSSVAVYGPVATCSTEATTPAPVTPYGASKLEGEGIVREWCQADSQRSAVVFRPTVVFGERNYANMLRLIVQIDKGRYFNVGKAANIKSIAYVRNLVTATVFAMSRMRQGVKIYNYSDEPQLSVAEIAYILSRSLGKNEPMALPEWALRVLALPFDVVIATTGRDLPISRERIRKLATNTVHSAASIRKDGYVPRFTTREGLLRMAQWYLAEKGHGRQPRVIVSSSG